MSFLLPILTRQFEVDKFLEILENYEPGYSLQSAVFSVRWLDDLVARLLEKQDRYRPGSLRQKIIDWLIEIERLVHSYL